MNDAPRQSLCDMIAQYGQSICKDMRRCEGLLRDSCGEHKRECFVLISALREQVVEDLLGAGPQSNPHVLLGRLAQRLHDNLGITEEAAHWSVESWAQALRFITAPDLETLARQSSESAPTLCVSPAEPGHYRRISDALEKAPPGSRIQLLPGVYRESLVIKKPVEILGQGPLAEIVMVSDQDHTLQVRADKVRVKGVTVRFRAAHARCRSAAIYVAHGSLEAEGCDISSDALSSVLVQGSKARIRLLHCEIHHGHECGVFVPPDGQAILEDCSIYRNELSGVQVQRGVLSMKRCKIHEQAANHGVSITGLSTVTLEECDIYENGLAGLLIAGGAKPVIRRTQIHHGRESGVLVHDKGQGVIEDCNIHHNANAGVVIKQGCAPRILRCRIHEQLHHYGVFCSEPGQGLIEECDIYGNALAGIGIRAGAAPTIRACRIHHHLKHDGIHLYENGKARIEECDIRDNAFAGIEICQESYADVRSSHIVRNGTVGIRVWQGGTGDVAECDLTNNAIGSWNIDPDCKVTQTNNRE